MIKLIASSITVDAAAGGTGQRLIMGIAAPYGVTANVSSGETVLFEPGSLTAANRMPRVYLYHDPSRPVGIVTALTDTPTELLFEARLSASPDGISALTMSAEGILDVSVGVSPISWTTDDAGVMRVTAANIDEISLVPQPAFAGAVLTEVLASSSIHQNEPEINNNSEVPTEKEIEPMETEAVNIEAATPTAPIWATAVKPMRAIPTAAEYISAFISRGTAFSEMRESIRAAAPAAPYIDTESNPGILPEIITNGIYNNFVGMRPVVDAFGVRAMPQSGQIFIRPSVNTNVSMAVQSAQNADLQAGTYKITRNQVTKETYGGYVVISEQDTDWTSPEILGGLLDDMARVYANTTDNVAADALVAGATTTEAFGDPTLPEDWTTWVATASQVILSASNGNLPNTLFVSPKYWGKLIGLSDTTGRPLFPSLSPMNAPGTSDVSNDMANSAFGCRVVVDRNFTDETVILGCASSSPRNPTGPGFECYEQQKGSLAVIGASGTAAMNTTISFRGYFATLMIDADKFVKASNL